MPMSWRQRRMSALAVPARDAEPTSHRQVLEALSGLLLAHWGVLA